MNKLLKGGLAVLGLFAGVCLAAFAEPSAATSGAARDRAQVMNRIDGLLAASKTFYLATVDGDQPKLRPLGAHHVVDGKVWLGVGEFKNVYRQLVANPKCEVVALQPAGGKWLRWTGRAVFADGAERERLEEVFLTAAPRLRRIYNKKPGKRRRAHPDDAARRSPVGRDGGGRQIHCGCERSLRSLPPGNVGGNDSVQVD